jgi:hypothetical protein
MGLSMADLLYIRDEIAINGALQAIVDQQPGGSTIRLLGRQIRHDPGFDLKLNGRNLLIVGDGYDGGGGSLDLRGMVGGGGAPGRPGSAGVASHNPIDNKPGGPGQAGGAGSPGRAGGTVKVICQSLSGGHLIATGGPGGAGGPGGGGGRGGKGVPASAHHEGLDGTDGGPGGPGGAGAAGGAGGRATMIRVNASARPLLEVAGGAGGGGGAGGPGGAGGLGAEAGARGRVGAAGPVGAAGSATDSVITVDEFWARARSDLGDSAGAWGDYRRTVGEYFFRRYDATDPARSGFLSLAFAEFDAALKLNPGDTQAARLQAQILADQNILGLARTLDLIPNFDRYISAFTGFGPLLFGTFNTGIVEVLNANEIGRLSDIVHLQQVAVENTVADTQDELSQAAAAQADAADEVTKARAAVADAQTQILAAQADQQNQSFSIGGLIGIVGEIGGAVASVIAAIPTGGASLIALVPDVIALSESVATSVGPITSALFAQEEPDLKKVKDTYGKVSKDVAAAITAGKTVVNFVNLVEKLAAGTTPDNSRAVALVQRGVELIHAELLAEHRNDQALLLVKAVQAKLDRTKALLAEYVQLEQNLQLDMKVLRDAGLHLIRSAQAHVDSLLGFAFRAQRSVEIYTLQAESRNVSFDAGYVHPDTDRDFAEGALSNAQLVAAYTDSWSRLLQPIQLQQDYLAYFDNNQLDNDIRRLSFTDPDLIQVARDTRAVSFTLGFADVPDGRFDAKVQGVFVAFIGAVSNSGIVSCQVRHGDRYEQRRPDGSVAVQLLRPRADIQPAGTARLELGGVVVSADPPLTAPQSLSIWGRGLVGSWDVSIPATEVDLEHLDLTALTEVQVWVGYQFLQ